MPLTPLFPQSGAPITIKQGKTGDCYFLASLDCVFNSGPEGVAKVKSLFTETEHGVTVRIKRTSISSHLKPEKLRGKYDYYYDKDRNEDVFIISKERLKIIDAPSIGVTTNSLAVKILEHLSSYYYVEDWAHNGNVMNSIVAHNVNNRHKGSSTEFMGYLLGINTEDLRDIDKIIKFKTIAPDYPIYISMDYGASDAFGKYHGRHGLRIDKIVANPSSPGGYDFVLVNPWNNQRKETYSLNDIKLRHYRFCIFNTNPVSARLTRVLLSLPTTDGKDIASTPALYNMLLEFEALTPGLNSEAVKRSLALYKNMPQMTQLFKALRPSERMSFLTHVYKANGDEDSFLAALLLDTPRLDVTKFILNHGKLGLKSTPVAVDICLRGKSNELFRALKKVDFLTQINNSRLDKNVFLSNLIDLHLAQPEVNFNQLNAIAIYIKRYNLAHSPRVLTVDFSEETIFNLALSKAINEKAMQLGGNKEEAKKQIETGLVKYYFDNNSLSITRLGGLRFLFEYNGYPNTLIERIDSPEWLTHFLNTGTLSPAIREKLAGIPQDLTQNQLETIFNKTSVDNPRTLFLRLYELSKLNPEIATMLHHNLAEQFNQKFGMEFSVFTEQVRLEKNSDFTKWFFNAIPALEEVRKERAQLILFNYLDKIRALPVPIESVHSLELIDAFVLDLTSKLRKLSTESALIEAQKQLGEQGKEEAIAAINDAIDRKIKGIRVLARVQTSILRTVELTIDEGVRNINSFPYSFANTYTSSEIQRKKNEYNHDLRVMVSQDKKLSEALDVLGLTRHPVIAQALKAKSAEMELAAVKQQQTLNKDLEVIMQTIESLSSISTSFSHLSSIDLVNQESKAQLDKLYHLMSDEKVVKAQLALGLKGKSHPVLKRAIERHAQAIIEGAEAQVERINAAQSILEQCEAQIKKFPISFADMDSGQKIQDQQLLLLFRLNQVVHNSEIKNALAVLNLKGLPRTAQEALSAKQEEIYQAAAKQNEIVLVAEKNIALYIQRINDFNTTALVGGSNLPLTKKCAFLINNLRQIPNESELQNNLGIVSSANKRIQDALAAKEQRIWNAAAKIVLNESGFLAHLDIILEKTLEFERKAEQDSTYADAAKKARKLYGKLDDARSDFLNKPGTLEERLQVFKSETNKAIEKALPTLKEHRGWKQVLADVANAILTVGSGFTSYLATNRFRIFAVPTDAEKKALDLKQNIKQMTLRGG